MLRILVLSLLLTGYIECYEDICEDVFLNFYNETKIPGSPKCSVDEDCPKYNICLVRPFEGSICKDSGITDVNCGVANAHGENYPSHQICIDDEIEKHNLLHPDLAIFRCLHTSRGFRCGNAFGQGCTNMYDKDGRITMSKTCPKNFRCSFKKFQDGYENVCLPEYQEGNGYCHQDFDCAFSTLTFRWTKCINSKCTCTN